MAYTDRAQDYGWANGSPNPDLVDITDSLPWRPRNSAGRTQTVWAHRLLAPRFLDAAEAAVASGWVPQRTDSYVERQIRGSGNWSLHSWAIAWDIFSTPSDVPPPGGVWTPTDEMPPSFVEAFEDRGFTWGGRWNRRDTPHIEWSGPPPTSLPPGEDDVTPAQAKQLDRIEQHVKVLTDGNPFLASVWEASNKANYSLAGVGDDNIRDYIAGLADGSVSGISDADLNKIAAAVADEQARRMKK